MTRSVFNSCIAIMVSCFNRKEKTLSCLKSVFSQADSGLTISIYLMDNGSDGTSEEVTKTYPEVIILKGDSNLYWAGSMRRAWQYALESTTEYDFFLLLNDDTILTETALKDLLNDYEKLNREAILIGSTLDPQTNIISYGGYKVMNKYGSDIKRVIPNFDKPLKCDLGNGNIMFVPGEVVKKIGILSDLFTHGIADYDYTLRAKKNGIPSYIGSNYSGFCTNDHGNKWWNAKQHPLKERIRKLYDVKGLAYREYLLYLRLYFPYYLPQAWFMLWLKTLFPFLWEKLKKDRAE
ncbi:MAG: glycosyltransferase [Ginsengibacter sp.]